MFNVHTPSTTFWLLHDALYCRSYGLGQTTTQQQTLANDPNRKEHRNRIKYEDRRSVLVLWFYKVLPCSVSALSSSSTTTNPPISRFLHSLFFILWSSWLVVYISHFYFVQCFALNKCISQRTMYGFLSSPTPVNLACTSARQSLSIYFSCFLVHFGCASPPSAFSFAKFPCPKYPTWIYDDTHCSVDNRIYFHSMCHTMQRAPNGNWNQFGSAPTNCAMRNWGNERMQCLRFISHVCLFTGALFSRWLGTLTILVDTKIIQRVWF